MRRGVVSRCTCAPMGCLWCDDGDGTASGLRLVRVRGRRPASNDREVTNMADTGWSRMPEGYRSFEHENGARLMWCANAPKPRGGGYGAWRLDQVGYTSLFTNTKAEAVKVHAGREVNRAWHEQNAARAPIVPVGKLASAWRESAESCEASEERTDGTDAAEWAAFAGQLRDCADDLDRSMEVHPDEMTDRQRLIEAYGRVNYAAQGEFEEDPRVQLACALLDEVLRPQSGTVPTVVVEAFLSTYATILESVR